MTWVHYCEPENKVQSCQQEGHGSLRLKQLKTIICNAQAAQDNHLQCSSSSRQSSAMLKQLKTIICNAQAAQDNHLQCSSSSRQSSAMLKQLKTIICNAQAAQDNHLQCSGSSRQSSAMLKQLKTIICKALQMIVLSCLSLRDPCPSCWQLWTLGCQKRNSVGSCRKGEKNWRVLCKFTWANEDCKIRKKHGKLSNGVLLQQDNARVHNCKVPVDAVEWNR